MSFDSWWEWWITSAPWYYLNYADAQMFKDYPAKTSTITRKAKLRARWKKHKSVFKTSFVMRHWLLIIIQAVYDKTSRENQKLQESVPGHLSVYLEPSFLRCFEQPMTFFSSNFHQSFVANVQMSISGFYNFVTTIDVPSNPQFFSPGMPIDFSPPLHYESQTFFGSQFGICCPKWFAWSVRNSETGEVYTTFPILEHLIKVLQREVEQYLVPYLPPVICDLLTQFLGLSMMTIDEPVPNWFWTHAANFINHARCGLVFP